MSTINYIPEKKFGEKFYANNININSNKLMTPASMKINTINSITKNNNLTLSRSSFNTLNSNKASFTEPLKSIEITKSNTRLSFATTNSKQSKMPKRTDKSLEPLSKRHSQLSYYNQTTNQIVGKYHNLKDEKHQQQKTSRSNMLEYEWSETKSQNNLTNVYNSDDDDYDWSSFDGLVSSASSTKTIEDAESMEHFFILLRKRLFHVDKSYSMEALFNCLRNQIKNNSYGSYNLKFLEQFLDVKNLKSLNNYVYYPVTFKSIDSRTSFSRNSKRTSNGQSSPKAFSFIEPVEKLFRSLNLLKRVYKLIQRDIIFAILTKKVQTEDGDSNVKRDAMKLNNFLKNQTKLSKDYTLKLADNNHHVSHKDHFNHSNNPHQRKFLSEEKPNKISEHDMKRLLKCHEYLYSYNEKINSLLNDFNGSDVRLLSDETKLPSKYEFYKHGEYILRLIPDIIFKMKFVLKVCQKCLEITDNFEISRALPKMSKNQSFANSNGNYYSKNKLPMIVTHEKLKKFDQLPVIKSQSRNSKHSDQTNNSKNAGKGLKTPASKVSFKDFDSSESRSESAIQETDSSILSDDEFENNYQNFKQNKTPPVDIYYFQYPVGKTPNQYKQNTHKQQIEAPAVAPPPPPLKLLPPIDENTNSVDHFSSVKQQNHKAVAEQELGHMYHEYLNKRDEIGQCELKIEELRNNIRSLFDRTDRCSSIKDKMSSVISLIRQTEQLLEKTEDDKQVVKKVLQSELNIRKYQLKLLLQDLEVEEVVKSEINVAIQDTSDKLNKFQRRYEELNEQLNKLDKEIKILYKQI